MSDHNALQLSSPIKIWYEAIPDTPRIRWPIVDLRMAYHGKELPQSTFGLVDSGASISILHLHIAEILGIDLVKLGRPEFTGQSVSGSYKSWVLPKPVRVNIYGYEFDFRFEVIDNPRLSWPCILGEDSIFQVARIDFQKFKGFFEVRFRQDIN